MSPPSVTQSTPSAFAEAVTNVRLLSWLLLGALQANQPCLPVPISCSQYMADYIHFVLAGFADQSKVVLFSRSREYRSSRPFISSRAVSLRELLFLFCTVPVFQTCESIPLVLQQSVVHMSALFHAFHLCQLWTVYCEQAAMTADEFQQSSFANILDFWARVTPAILQLLSHSKVVSAPLVRWHPISNIAAFIPVNYHSKDKPEIPHTWAYFLLLPEIETCCG